MSNRLIFIFSFLGLFVSAFLAYEYTVGSVVCPLGGTGCDTVRLSPYSRLLGISLPYWGIIFYLGMMAWALLRTSQPAKDLLKKLQLLGAISGFSFGVYLTYLEAFVINAYCFWCLTSFIISAIILLLAVPWKSKNENRD